jgi:hypothetical protein
MIVGSSGVMSSPICLIHGNGSTSRGGILRERPMEWCK